MFKTSNFVGEKNNGADPFSSMYPNPSSPLDNQSLQDKMIIDVNKYYGNSLPLAVGDNTSISNLLNYIIVYAHSPVVDTTKRGIEVDDSGNGIIHYKLGRDRGIVKKIKFSKTDMQYLREARYFNHGHDGILQLAAVYKASMEMIGNTLYYPGMEFFINPMGFIGSDREADPTIVGSVANRLGFGGYHLVTSVKSSIGPGKFTTTVEGLWHYSGDGKAFKLLSGKKRVGGTADKIEDKPAEGVNPMSKDCNFVYSQIINSANNLVQGRANTYEKIEMPSKKEENTGDRVEPANPIDNPEDFENILRPDAEVFDFNGTYNPSPPGNGEDNE